MPRQQEIIKLLSINGFSTVDELTKILDCSPATIRRDLQILSKKNIVKKVFGGVILRNVITQQSSLSEKIGRNKEGKQKVAQYATELVQDGMSIFLDAGTSILACCPFLITKKIRVVTVDLNIALSLIHGSNIELIMIGGVVDIHSQSVAGVLSENMIQQMNFDISFISCSAWNIHNGSMIPTENKLNLKSFAMAHSQQKVLITDHTKYGMSAFYTITLLENYDKIYCNNDFDSLTIKNLENINNLHLV